jgi:hypothetical protein
MKNYLIIALVGLIVVLFLLRSCDKPKETIIDNSHLLNKIDSLELNYDVLKANSIQLELAYQKQKERKDSVVYKLKNQYIMVYDTITKDTVECLPKPYVDNLVLSFEYVLESSDSLISVKSSQIGNLEQQNNIKDTIILSHKQQVNELQKSVKKEKRKKWLFGVTGFGFGYLFGKSF